ncbi:carboxypeptidase-like regulatory domain-containing protein, partial [Parapedobacter sp.]
HPAEKQDVRLAKVTPKAGISANPPDSTVVVGYGTQKKSALAGATARLVAAEMDSPVVVNGEALAGRTHGIRIRGISASPARMQPVVGKVVDKETQEPLAGVAIQFTDGHTVATDKQGRFEAIDSSQILTARYIGYETQTIRINGRDSVTIALRPSKTGLGEVVVVGYGQLRHQTEAENVGHTENKPTPKNGWAAYRQYLKDAAKLAPGKGGAVELTFTVDDSGRPTDVAIVKTSNVELNKFATLIVRDGPLWVPGVNDERKVTLRIDF